MSDFICSTPRCATARRPTASISRWPTSSPSSGMLDELGIDYIEGGYPGANPTDTQLFAEPRLLNDDLHRLRHDAAARPLDLERSRPRCAARRQGRGDLLRRQVLGLPRQGRARDHARGKPRLDPRQRARRQGQGPRGAARLRAFLRRLQGQPVLCAGLRQDRLRGGRALGGAVRHQRRHAAARGRGDRRRGGQAHPRRSSRHPRSQRHRAGGGEFVRRRPRRRAPDPGHAQRARRALRQRQSRLDHPDAEAQAGISPSNSRSASPTRS